MRTILSMGVAACLAGAIAWAGPAQAYPVTVVTADTMGTQFNAGPNGLAGFTNKATVSFNYSGPLIFSNTAAQNANQTGDLNSTFFGANAAGISGYPTPPPGQTTVVVAGLGPVANFSTLGTFLASSGSAAGYTYGSLYRFNLGQLGSGTTLTITHDDGVSVYKMGVLVSSTTSGPTGVVTEMVELLGTGETILYYARENGTPSVLSISVPEPASIALVGASLAGLGLFRRRRA